MGSTNTEKRRWRHIELLAAVFICSIFLILTACPFAFGYYFKDRFFPNTIVAGVNVSRMKYGDSMGVMAEKYDNLGSNKINVRLAGRNYSFTLESVGIKYEWRKQFNETFQDQRKDSIWKDGARLIKDVLTIKQTNTPAKLVVKKNNISQKLDEILKEVNTQPVDASIKNENDQFVIVKEIHGVGVDKTTLETMLYQKLKESTHQEWRDVYLEFQATDLQPIYTENDLQPVKQQAETMTQIPIKLIFENFNFSLNNKTITRWVKFQNEQGKVMPVIDQTAVAKDIANISKKIDIKPTEKRISSVDGSIIQEGKDGRMVDKNRAVADVIAIFSQPLSVQTAQAEYTVPLKVDPKPFETKVTAPPFTPGMYPGKYIEVNLSNQTMYLWEGQNMVQQYRISSGRPSMPTREGVFSIYNKAAVGRSYPWIMPWWMAFAQDRWGAWQGIHELPVDMRTGRKEGIQDIGLAVSHGCVRLAIGDAKAVYDWAEVGIPVYIHK